MNFKNILVHCTFELKGGTPIDHERAYDALAKMSLKKTLAGGNGTIALPAGSVVGEFSGQSAEKLRDDVRGAVRLAFDQLGLRSEIFVLTATDFAAGATSTG